MRRLLAAFPRRRLLAAALALAAAGIGLCLGSARAALCARPDAQAAQRWSGDGTRFAQLALYLPADDALSRQSLNALRSSIAEQLTGAALSANEGARLWLDAASCQLEAAAASDQGAATVNVTAVAGDYFYFHPLQLCTGAGFAESDEMHDTVVLDELAAWQLFGSWDVAGREITLDGVSYTVCGVAAMPTAAADRLCYGERGRVWTSALRMLNEDAALLTCYEAVLPDPYGGFAADLLAGQSAAATGTVVGVSARYGFGSLLGTLGALPRAGMRPDGALYPYWENAARYTQTRAALLLGGQLLCLVWPTLLCCVWLIGAWRHRRWHLRDAVAFVDGRIQRRRQAAWERAHAGGEPQP